MKKSFINLRHPEHIDIRSPQARPKSLCRYRYRHSLLSELSQDMINVMMSMLRLAELVNLYWSVRYCHRYDELRRSMLNYLILTNRSYTKWEEKEFLDLLVPEIRRTPIVRVCNFFNQNRQQQGRKNIQQPNKNLTIQTLKSQYQTNPQKNQIIQKNPIKAPVPTYNSYNNGSRSQFLKSSDNRILNVNGNGNSQFQGEAKKGGQNYQVCYYEYNGNNNNNFNYGNNNNQSKYCQSQNNCTKNLNNNDILRLNRDKQSIANDVNRTYLKKYVSYSSNTYSRSMARANNQVRRVNSNIQTNIERRGKNYNKFYNNQQQNQSKYQDAYENQQSKVAQDNNKQINGCHTTLPTQNHSSSNPNLLKCSQILSSNNTNVNNSKNVRGSNISNNINNNNNFKHYEINLEVDQKTLPKDTSLNNPITNLPTNYKLTRISSYQNQSQQLSKITQNPNLNSQFSHTNTNSMQDINPQQRMQNFLKNVLIRISQKYPIIGYIQGFNYIAKNMYMTGFEEDEAFRYLSFFIEGRSLGHIVLNNMEGIKQLSYVLKVYIFNYVPKVYKHLIKAEMQPEMFATSWFVTLFSEDLAVDIVNKLWHLFVLEGWKIFIKFGIAFICAYQNQILQKDPDQIFCFMRRILEKFNEEARGKTRGGRIWAVSKRQEVVWKLMSSVEVNGSIMNQLCRQMKNLQKDSQIQIWRIEETPSNKRSSYSRNQRTYSHKTLTYSQARDKAERSSLVSSNAHDPSMGSQLCCDRMSYVNENTTQVPAEPRRKNLFSLCHNVGPYID